jgi:hypothetical protein
LDIPLSSFTGMTTRGSLAQLIVSGGGGSDEVYLDNLYLYKAAPTAPTAAASAPTRAAADVISLFSDTYTNRSVGTWSASWDQADVSDVSLGGNAVKKYSNIAFAGIEFTGSPINATSMTHLHVDVWKKNASSAFKLKLVDFGADGVYGGGNDVEHELVYNGGTGTPSIAGGEWVGLDIPLSSFTGMTTRGSLAQLIVSGGGGSDEVYLDNLYLYKQPSTPVL